MADNFLTSGLVDWFGYVGFYPGYRRAAAQKDAHPQ